MNIFKTFLGLFCILGIFMLTAPDADAARMGGGRSFGASPTIKAPINKAPSMVAPGVGAAGAAQAGGVARSGFGGLFGGLLAGSLIGSLFMGGGLGGLGGFGMFDILLIGLVIFLVFKLLGSRMQKREAPQQTQAKPYDMWSNLSSQEQVVPASTIENFNQDEFLKGAKIAFTRLQASWDKRDLDDIAQFANQEVMETIRQQAEDEPEPSKTEILMINASIVNEAKEKDQELVSVYFDVLMREDKEETNEVKEIWHFARPNAESNWKLAGIKQVN